MVGLGHNPRGLAREVAAGCRRYQDGPYFERDSQLILLEGEEDKRAEDAVEDEARNKECACVNAKGEL